MSVYRGGASLDSLRSARSVPVVIVEIMFTPMLAFMSVYGGGRLARLASLGSLGARLHCGDHVHIHVRTHVCVQEVTF